MTLTTLYHDFRSARREARLRKTIARLSLTLDPSDPFERAIAVGIAQWSYGQPLPADRAMGNIARAARSEGES